MRKTLIAAGAGLLAACSLPVQAPAPPPAPSPSPSAAALVGEGRYAEAAALLEQRAKGGLNSALLGDLAYAYYLGGNLAQAQAVLEQACLAEPSNPLAWERLAALMEASGESGRALEAMRHARLLREAAAPVLREPQAGSGPDATDSLWPAGMARVEVRQVSAGLVEVARVERPAPARLEVSNGNGIRGMAAAVARRLREQGMQVVRLTNTIPFDVEETRVEIRGNGEPQLRIVLGKDAGIKKPPGVSRRQAP